VTPTCTGSPRASSIWLGSVCAVCYSDATFLWRVHTPSASTSTILSWPLVSIDLATARLPQRAQCRSVRDTPAYAPHKCHCSCVPLSRMVLCRFSRSRTRNAAGDKPRDITDPAVSKVRTASTCAREHVSFMQHAHLSHIVAFSLGPPPASPWRPPFPCPRLSSLGLDADSQACDGAGGQGPAHR